MKEIWRVIPNTEERYFASNLGRISSTPRRGGPALSRREIVDGRFIIQQSKDAYGYLQIKVRIGSKRLSIKSHKAVLTAFGFQKTLQNPQVRHLNGIKTDNRIENLVWGNNRQNQLDRFTHGTDGAGEKNYNSVLTNLAARWIRDKVSAGSKQRHLASYLGVSPSHVWNVVHDKTHRFI